MKIIVLNNRSQISPFVERVYQISKSDAFIFLDEITFGQSLRKKNKSFSYPVIQDVPSESTLIIFDIFLVPTLTVLKAYEGKKIIFVQHGAMFDLAQPYREKNLKISSAFRYLMVSLKFLKAFSFRLKAFVHLLKVFRRGSWSAVHFMEETNLKINRSLFWVGADARLLEEKIPKVLGDIYLSKSPDTDLHRFTFSPTGKVAYIGQPFVEDGIIGASAYDLFVSLLRGRYGQRLIFIRHPRQLSISKSNSVLLSELDELEVSKVVGHYSSLLLALPNDIPMELEDFGMPNLREKVISLQNALALKSDDELPNFDHLLRELTNV